MTRQPTYSSLLGNQELLDWLSLTFPNHISPTFLLINIDQQRLYHLHNRNLLHSYIISSALNGIGSQNGSGQTPLGAHCIPKKFGDNAPIGNVFKGRINTGEIATILTNKNTLSHTDNITSRILWLSGLEAGKNQGGNVDSYQRYIYIHGTDEEGRLGKPVSHGCIRMANQDIIELFKQVEINTFVYIIAQ